MASNIGDSGNVNFPPTGINPPDGFEFSFNEPDENIKVLLNDSIDLLRNNSIESTDFTKRQNKFLADQLEMFLKNLDAYLDPFAIDNAIYGRTKDSIFAKLQYTQDGLDPAKVDVDSTASKIQDNIRKALTLVDRGREDNPGVELANSAHAHEQKQLGNKLQAIIDATSQGQFFLDFASELSEPTSEKISLARLKSFHSQFENMIEDYNPLRDNDERYDFVNSVSNFIFALGHYIELFESGVEAYPLADTYDNKEQMIASHKRYLSQYEQASEELDESKYQFPVLERARLQMEIAICKILIEKAS